MAEQYANSVSTTLNGGITSGAASLIVTSATGFPSTGDFRLKVDNELMLCTARTGTTCTVTRGVEGTSAVAHVSGATVSIVLTAASLHAIDLTDLTSYPGGGTTFLRDDGTWAAPAGGGSAIDTSAFGSEPGSPSSGDLVLYSNAPQLARYTGSAWAPWGPIWPLTAPVNGDFSWSNQGSATVATTYGGIYLEAPAATGENVRLRVKSQPSTPYTITALVMANVSPNDYNGCGICLRESGTGKIAAIAPSFNSTFALRAYRWTNATTFSSTAASAANWVPTVPVWLRLSNDNTTLLYQYSYDGFIWRTLYSELKAAFFSTAPDQVGFFANSVNATHVAGIRILSWAQA